MRRQRVILIASVGLAARAAGVCDVRGWDVDADNTAAGDELYNALHQRLVQVEHERLARAVQVALGVRGAEAELAAVIAAGMLMIGVPAALLSWKYPPATPLMV